MRGVHIFISTNSCTNILMFTIPHRITWWWVPQWQHAPFLSTWSKWVPCLHNLSCLWGSFNLIHLGKALNMFWYLLSPALYLAHLIALGCHAWSGTSSRDCGDKVERLWDGTNLKKKNIFHSSYHKITHIKDKVNTTLWESKLTQTLHMGSGWHYVLCGGLDRRTLWNHIHELKRLIILSS